MIQEWRPIRDFEDAYKVSNHAEITSVERYVPAGHGSLRIVKESVVKQITNPRTGDVTVSLWKENRGKKLKVSRLVAEAFLPDWDPELEVYHLDGNPGNNVPSNLAMRPRGTGRDTSNRGSKNTDVENLPGEEWRDCPGFQVQASNFGRLLRKPITRTVPQYTRTMHGTTFTQSGSEVPEPAVILAVIRGSVMVTDHDGKHSRQMASRLVASAWHGELDFNQIVTFRDSVSSNLRPDNLRVETQAERAQRTQAQKSRRND